MTTYTWVGGTGLASNPANWSPDGTPRAGDIAIIGSGTAIFDGKGELCGKARALWIEPRTTGTVSEMPTPAK